MRKLYFLCLLITGFALKAQTAFWTENFGNSSGCDNGATVAAFTSTNGSWSITNTGTNDLYANTWYISAAEAGMGIGNCGNGCVTNSSLNNRTLHVGLNFVTLLDQGATYLAGNGVADTDKRVESPTINCSNASAITLTVSYIMWGITSSDYCQVQYYNGSVWSNLGIPAQTPTTSCSGQGLWTGYTVTLPASANNNPNVKIGFRWQNVDNTGSDPSVAIDNIALIGTVATPTAVMSPSFSISSPMCVGQSATLTANTGTTSATGYTWSAAPAGASFSAPNSSVTNVSFSSANTFSITLTAASGTLVGSVTHTVLVNPLPTVNAAATNSATCAGGANTLTASGSATSFTWQPGNLSGASVTVAPTSATIYTVSGSSAAGCVNTNTVAFNVNQAPNVSISANSASLCMGSVETLTANGALTYTWQPGNTNGSTLSINPSATTIYTVAGTSSAGCVGNNTISISVITCTNTGIASKTGADISFDIYPNPFDQELNISNPNTSSNFRFNIADATGKIVKSGIIESNSTKINTSDLSKGIYFFELLNEKNDRLKSYKIIKE